MIVLIFCSAMLVMILLLVSSFAMLIQNQLLPSSSQQSSSSLPIPSLVYADKIKVKNKSLINEPFAYSNNNGIGITELGLPMNNKIVPATARGIPNQFIIVLKDSLDSSSNINTPSTLSIPSSLIPSDTDSFDRSSSTSSRLAGRSNNALRDISQQAILMGARVPHIFDSVIHGFTAIVPNQQVIDVLAKDPRVAYIEQDQRVQAFQTLPTGIDRVDADLSPARSGDGTGSVNADIAILDTGIDLSHPDL